MQFSEITASDIPELFHIRTSVRENLLTLDDLTEAGITTESVTQMLAGSHKGWLCRVDGQAAGFVMADRTSGELWVLAVLPQFEGQGIGSALLRRAEDWLFSLGWKELWLWTDTDKTLRAYQLYHRHGWVDSRTEEDTLYLKKTAPAAE